MLFLVLLIYLAICAPSASAFFPFRPDWMKELQDRGIGGTARRGLDGRDADSMTLLIESRAGNAKSSESERALREAARLFSKYDSQAVTETLGDNTLTRRNNEFRVLKAATPSTTEAAGIDQDGTDYSYFTKMGFGSKGKRLYVLIDTGAGSSWVMGSRCNDKSCLMHDTFGTNDSDTLEVSSRDFSITYGTGAVSGQLVVDTVDLAGMSFMFQFGLAYKTSEDFSQFAFDGILGLSMGRSAEGNYAKAMARSGKLKKNIFCVALSRASDGRNTGEIKFGSTNKDKYTGDITYTPVSSPNGDWAIQIDDMAYDGKAAGVGGVLSYIDTGTSFIFGPEEFVKKVHSKIPGAESSDGKTYAVPCASNDSLTFSFSGVDFEVSPKDWISPPDSRGKCTSNIYGHEVVKGSWLLGDTFLKNVYTVFDTDEKRIGFAKLAVARGTISRTAVPSTTTWTVTSSRETSPLTKTRSTDSSSSERSQLSSQTPSSSGGRDDLQTSMSSLGGDPGQSTPTPGSATSSAASERSHWWRSSRTPAVLCFSALLALTT